MCARRSASPTAPTSSIPAKCSSRAEPTISHTTLTCDGSIWARNSAFDSCARTAGEGDPDVVSTKKQESDQVAQAANGADPKTANPAKPGVGHDAAADASHQAAPALKSRFDGLCRSGARAQSAARAWRGWRAVCCRQYRRGND